MIHFEGRGILLDIEGTVCPVRYVHDVLFGYARDRLEAYLERRWDTPEVAAARERVARDAGAVTFEQWAGSGATDAERRRELVGHLNRLMEGDAKATGLKQIQGLIWHDGFVGGELRAPLYDDVAPALRNWAAAGVDVRIFSSGSVAAQKDVFRYSTAGDLSGVIRGYFDTTTGPKREAGSYRAIAAAAGLAPGGILFVSDVISELDAARGAGCQTALCVREGGAAPADSTHPVVRRFDEITVA